MKKISKRKAIKKFEADYMKKYTTEQTAAKEPKTITFRLVPFIICMVLLLGLTTITTYRSFTSDFSKPERPINETLEIEEYIKDVCDNPTLNPFYSFSTGRNVCGFRIYKEQKRDNNGLYSYFYELYGNAESICLAIDNQTESTTLTSFGEIDEVYLNTNISLDLFINQKPITCINLFLEQ